MVAKINYGANLYGALFYNYEKVTRGMAEILSGNRIISDRLGMPSKDMHLTLLSFENYLLANRKTEKPVMHVSLSPSPEDCLTDGQLIEMADKYMERLGYGGQPYVVYKHFDTQNVHLHIVSVCVDENGMRLNSSFEWRRSQSICRELEKEYGLRNAESECMNLKAKLEKVNISQGNIRHQVGNTLKAVLESYRFQTFGEYSALLSTLNIEVKQVKGEYKGNSYTGIIYFATDDNGKIVSPPFKSSRFGKRFGMERLEKKLFSHMEDFKKGKWKGSIEIKGKVANIMRIARSREELETLLERESINVVFRKSETGRIYGVTFIDHTNKEVYNGSRLGKEFSANIFNALFNEWNGTLKTKQDWVNGAELKQSFHHEAKQDNILEQAAGLFSLETNPFDKEEEAFMHRMQKKKKQSKRKSRGI